MRNLLLSWLELTPSADEGLHLSDSHKTIPKLKSWILKKANNGHARYLFIKRESGPEKVDNSVGIRPCITRNSVNDTPWIDQTSTTPKPYVQSI